MTSAPLLNPHQHKGHRISIPAAPRAAVEKAMAPRAVEPWKVRWCEPCSRFEYDVGAHRGWVALRGAPAADVLAYLHRDAAGRLVDPKPTEETKP